MNLEVNLDSLQATMRAAAFIKGDDSKGNREGATLHLSGEAQPIRF